MVSLDGAAVTIPNCRPLQEILANSLRAAERPSRVLYPYLALLSSRLGQKRLSRALPARGGTLSFPPFTCMLSSSANGASPRKFRASGRFEFS